MNTANKRFSLPKLLLCVAIPLAVGGVSAFLTRNSYGTYDSLQKPPGSPPAWLFPIVWTVLYVLMGIASYLVWQKKLQSPATAPEVESALNLYTVQLALNFFWPLVFFNKGAFLGAFIVLAVMFVFIISAFFAFLKLKSAAGYLLVPYILWTAYAGYLNLGVFILN